MDIGAVSLGSVVIGYTDLIRLILFSVFIWLSIEDIRSRRISIQPLKYISIIGLLLMAIDIVAVWGTFEWGYTILQIGISIGVFLPLVFALAFFGLFGGGDFKAMAALILLFPMYPRVDVSGVVLPVYDSVTHIFILATLSNAVLISLIFPISILCINILYRNFDPRMILGIKVDSESTDSIHGTLLHLSDRKPTAGLDLDVLRMYLQWLNTPIDEIRLNYTKYRNWNENSETYEDSITDGATTTQYPKKSSDLNDGLDISERNITSDEEIHDDLWGAESFITELEYTYGSTITDVRNGLDEIVTNDSVWISPGIPFVVPLTIGAIISMIYGNMLMFIIEILI